MSSEASTLCMATAASSASRIIEIGATVMADSEIPRRVTEQILFWEQSTQ